MLALGLAAAVEWLAAAVARRPALAPAALALAIGAWNVALLEGVRASGAPAAPIAFAEVVENGARRMTEAVGSPPTWPASWAFAVRHRLPPGQYDLLVGRYLFYRQNNLQGRIDLGGAGDEALLGEGWGAAELREGAEARPMRGGRARILAPLDVPEDIEIAFRALAADAVPVRVAVNGREVGSFAAGPGWTVHRLAVGRDHWRRDLNDVVLQGESGGVWIDGVELSRLGVPEGQERGFRAR
jgi:hypothetical protein